MSNLYHTSLTPPFTSHLLDLTDHLSPMSHGHGSGQTNGGFAALVNNVIDGKKSQNDSSESQQTTYKGPSKGLPATGLKKNTLEWQESEQSNKGKGQQKKSRGM